jgi:pimeloyl-ACP methyl ester carboxylesterase
MTLLPIPLLINLILGVLSVAILAAGLALIANAIRRLRRRRPVVHETVVKERQNRPKIAHAVASTTTTAESDLSQPPAAWRWLAAGLVLLAIAFFGRHIVQLGFPQGQDEPQRTRSAIVRSLTRPDGTTIHAEVYGPMNAPTLVLTHGWGVSSTEWYYAKRQLADHFRLIIWDLPGLGLSDQFKDQDFALEKMAADLHTVLQLANGKQVVLVGHSIGGMVNLTFCRLYPKLLGSQVAGIVQMDTTYTNPVRTTKNAGFALAIQKPVAEPVLHAMILLSPVVRCLNWLSYQNGLAQLYNAHSSFGGSETRGQVDFVSQFQYRSSPAVVARGTLAMFHWDATPVLPRVNTPVLIVVGNQDSTTVPAASERMQQSIPGAQLQRINSSAHYSLLEQNQNVNAAVAQFASSVLNRASSGS